MAAAALVAGEEDVRQGREGALVGLLVEDVERGSTQMAGFQQVIECRLVEYLTAAGIEDVGTLAHGRHALARHDVFGLTRVRQMDGDGERAGDQLVEADIGYAMRRCPRVILADVMSQHLHAEGLGDHCHLFADAAATEDAEGLALPQDAGVAGPLALPQRLMAFDQAPRQRDQQAEHLLDDRARRRIGGERHRDAMVTAEAPIEAIQADPDAGDVLETRQPGLDRPSRQGLGSSQQHIDVTQQVRGFLGRVLAGMWREPHREAVGGEQVRRIGAGEAVRPARHLGDK